ncbi:hypothetical protein MG293_019016 [Ovis ammon polii]|uniref:Uncharacterized protein n=1 Tax=Ovis ammon polii TaxID=230172 RepID=A0AAD4TNU4_OVIAM|nr:hypothetical protein MG293_019016 [Ovis ammon polii]
MSPASESRVATAAPSPLPSLLPPPPPPTAAPPGPSEHFSRCRSARLPRHGPRLLRNENSPEVGRKVSGQRREPRPPPPRLRARAPAPARGSPPRPPSAAGRGGEPQPGGDSGEGDWYHPQCGVTSFHNNTLPRTQPMGESPMHLDLQERGPETHRTRTQVNDRPKGGKCQAQLVPVAIDHISCSGSEENREPFMGQERLENKLIPLKYPIQQLLCIILAHQCDSPTWKIDSFPPLIRECALPFNKPYFPMCESD